MPNMGKDKNQENLNINNMQGAVIPKVVVASPSDDAPPKKKRMKKEKKKKTGEPSPTLLKILILCFVVIGTIAGLYLYSFLQNEKYLEVINKDTFYDGIYVDDIHLGGLTKQQAYSKIAAQQKVNEEEIQVTVTWDDEEYSFYADDVEITYDTDKVLDTAYQTGRNGTNAERYEIVTGLQNSNVHYSTARQINPSPIEQTVRDIALSKVQTVSEPAVEFIPDTDKPSEEWFLYSDPIVGIQTDDEALWKSVEDEFIEQNFGTVPVPMWEIEPDEDIDFREITQLIVSFKTVQSRNSNREHNIALCCSMINGVILMPGEEFSMNDTTGERTKAKGFKEANTIVGGNELIPGIAGGVCQVSGTLYNAALRADLEITERYHHSFELGYLTRGRDATVNYGTADLKFVNTHDYPIYISMFTDGLDVYAQIYGAPLENCDHITIWVKTIKTIAPGDPVYKKNPEVPVGSEPVFVKGRQGITCKVYKIYNDADGNQIESELLYTDVYKKYAPELHVNPADYEGYINPTPEPTEEPTPEPTETPEPTDDGSGEGDGGEGGSVG